MKSTHHDDTLLRHTLQEIYSNSPQPSNGDWEQDLMRKIQSMPVTEEKSHTHVFHGWWIVASAVAAMALLVLTVTFWPMPEATTPQVETIKPTVAPPPAPTPLTTKRENPPEPMPVAASKPEQTPPPARVTATKRATRHAQASAPVQTQSAVSQLTEEKMEAETLPPYERPRRMVAPRQPARHLALVPAEDLRNMNDFSLAAYDRLMGIAEETSLPEQPVPTASSHNASVRVAQSMAATTSTALSQDLQSDMASRLHIHKPKTTEQL